MFRLPAHHPPFSVYYVESVQYCVQSVLVDGILLFHIRVNSRAIPLLSFMPYWKQFPPSYWSTDCVPLCSSVNIFLALLAWQDDVQSKINCLSFQQLAIQLSMFTFIHNELSIRKKIQSQTVCCVSVWFHDYWQNPDNKLWQLTVLDVRI